MGYSRTYGGFIWTRHAIEQLIERGVAQEKAWETIKHPDSTKKHKGAVKFEKEFGSATITVVAKQNKEHSWVVVSSWMNPPLPGTEDARKKEAYKRSLKSGFWGKLWYSVKQQLGL